MTDAGKRMTEPLHAKIYHVICEYMYINIWIMFGPVSEKFLSLSLQIHHVDLPAGSLSRTSYSSITGDHTEIYIHSDGKPRCPFHGARYLVDLVHERCQLPLEFIT